MKILRIFSLRHKHDEIVKYACIVQIWLFESKFKKFVLLVKILVSVENDWQRIRSKLLKESGL